MIADIRASFARRDTFEGAAALNAASSYVKQREMVLKSANAVARFFLALNIAPQNVIERKVVGSKMFNAKALKKIVELANFACNGSKRIEKVMSSFIICSLRWSSMNGDSVISNKHNKAFLSSVKFSDIIADSELADYLADYQHAYMSGGKDTQSSQARCVLEVLGLGEVVACDNRYRGAIKIAAQHAFFDDFCDVFLK
jgi:hypothetical protein